MACVIGTCNGQDLLAQNRPAGINRAKVMELLGAVSSEERRQINNLLNRTCSWDETFIINTSFTEDCASSQPSKEEDTTDEAIGLSLLPHTVAEPAISGPSCVENDVYQPQPTSPPKLASPSLGYVLARRGFMNLTIKVLAMSPRRPKKFRLLDKLRVRESTPWSAKSPWLCTPQCCVEKVGICSGAEHVGTFPLHSSPCFEKHQLLHLRDCTPKEVKPTAHPLPQPPLARYPADYQIKSCISDARKLMPRHNPYKTSLHHATASQCSDMSPNVLCKGAPQTTLILEAATQWQSPKGGKSQSIISTAQKLPNSPQSSSRQSRGGDVFSSHVSSMVDSYAHSTESLSSRLQEPKDIHLQSIVSIAQKLNNSSPSLVEQGESSSQGPAISARSPPLTTKPLLPRKWTKGVVLGHGTFGVVHEGLNLEDGSFFAVKISNTEDVSPEIQQEIDVLSKLKHPNIVRYFGSSIENGHLCIFLELVRMGCLEMILQSYKQFEDHTIRNYTRQILLGLEYLHANKTIHRDIKCANILVDVDGQVKLSDFGVAKQMDKSLASSLKGTPSYMAPEVLIPNRKCYSFSADIWSLGCTVLEMADGRKLEGFGFLFKVKDGQLPPMPEHLSPEGRDFVCRCLKLNAKDRPTATELLQHPFVNNVSPSEQFHRPVSTSITPSCNLETCLFPTLRSWQCEIENGSSARIQ